MGTDSNQTLDMKTTTINRKLIAGAVGTLFFFTLSRVLAQAPAPPPPLGAPEINVFAASFQQIWNNPASLTVFGTLCILAWLWDDMPFCESRYVTHFTTVCGMCIYWLFAGISSVPKSYPYPFIVLISNGMYCGFVAGLAHKKLIKRMVQHFGGPDVKAAAAP